MRDVRHTLLALLVVGVWGTNFVVIMTALRDFPPLLLALLRFVLSAIPFVFVLQRPRVPWRWLAIYGVFLGAGQFGLLYLALRSSISPGLASLIIQMQVFFTIALSMWVFGERLSAAAVVGSLVALAGLVLIASRIDASATPFGIAAVLGAAFCWACANIAVKQASASAERPFGMVAFVAWSSLFALPPLALLSAAFEGIHEASQAIAHARLDAWAAVAWQAIGNSIFGFAAWSYLLARYDASLVTPWALLIPVFGMGTSALVLDEPLPAWKLAGGALVLCGIATIVLAPRVRARPA